MTLSPRVWSVLEPVKVLMPRLNAFVQRKVAREIGRQLDAGTSVPRLRHRLEQRLAVTGLADVRDPGRWLLGVALPWWSHCGHQACEAGVIWDSQTACHTCDEILEDRRVARERERRISAGLCPDHVTPPARDGSCVDCEIEQMLSVPQSLTPPRFPVRLCAGCDRPFQTSADAGELCLTCRSGVANSSVEVQTSPSPGSCCSGCGLHTTRALPGGRCLGCAQRALLSVGGGTLSA